MSALVVAVGSVNPVKKRAAYEAVGQALGVPAPDIRGVEVPSGVAEQPFGDKETLTGARRRAAAVRRAEPAADLWIGVEGGVAPSAAAEISPEPDVPVGDGDGRAYAGALDCMAWAVVLGVRPADGREASGHVGLRRGESRTATFTLPEEIAALVRSGVELGEATDRVLGGTDTKRGSGTVGPLTGGAVDRSAYYAHALVLALIPFLKP